MTFPWVPRSLYNEMTSQFIAQLAELKQERQILLDRLAVLGLGGPLFQTSPEAAQEEEPTSLADDLQYLRRRPSRLAEALTRRGRRHPWKWSAPSVAWVPQAESRAVAALDQAEATAREKHAH